MSNPVCFEPATTAACSRTRAAVVQVTWSFAAGGSERYTLDVASLLDRRKYQACICALDSGGPLEVDARNTGVTYSLLNRRSGISLRLVWQLYRLFRSCHARIIHTHHFSSLVYSALGAKFVRARLVHTEHGLSTYQSHRLRVALRVLSWFCDAVVAVGTESERFLSEQVGIAPEKLSVIPGGVHTERFQVPRDKARAILGVRESDRVAVIVARLSPEKNHCMLLTAFREVTKQIDGAKLLIVGEGPEREAIEAEICRLGLDDCVEMLGVRRDIPEILAASDVFVLSSNREALPISVLEAMAAGLPVVATDVGDVHTVVESGVNGRLVPPGDPKALAAATVDLMSNRKLASRLGVEGKARVQQFSVDNMVRKYEDLYLKSLADGCID